MQQRSQSFLWRICQLGICVLQDKTVLWGVEEGWTQIVLGCPDPVTAHCVVFLTLICFGISMTEHFRLVPLFFFFSFSIIIVLKVKTPKAPLLPPPPAQHQTGQLKRRRTRFVLVFISKLIFVYQNTKVDLSRGSGVLTQRVAEEVKWKRVSSRWPFAAASPVQPLHSPALMPWRGVPGGWG